jgi:polyhydroxyalkanoate synthase
MRDGIFAALDAVESTQPDPTVATHRQNLLAATAYMAPNDDRVHSATFWAAHRFQLGGRTVGVCGRSPVGRAETEDGRKAALPGSKMASAFNMLRANDLIWSFVINNYLLGKQPMPFDLLYYPIPPGCRRRHLSYLRNC